MAVFKFVNLLAVSSIAILACSFGATPAAAISTSGLHARDISAHGHIALAKKRSTAAKRCKVRPSSSSAAPKATTTKKASNNAGSGSGGSDPSSTKTSSSAKSTATYTAPSGSGKVGLAWPNGPDPSLKNFVTDQVKYIYTWSPSIPSNAKGLGLTPLPMLWGDNQIDDFKKLVVKGYANIVLGFNEPNESGQSNMTPEHGASLWKQYIEPLKNEGYQLISPATSSNPNGLTWVKNFLKACDGGCTLDGVAIHYYDVTPEGFIKYIENWHNTFNLPVWPTEFACQNFNGGAQCSSSEVANFYETIIEYMEKADWVPAYFAFGVMKDMQGVNTLNQLMTSSGTTTSLGKKYIDASF